VVLEVYIAKTLLQEPRQYTYRPFYSAIHAVAFDDEHRECRRQYRQTETAKLHSRLCNLIDNHRRLK